MAITRTEGTRLERERDYWNDLYSPVGENSAKYEWSRTVEEHSYVAQSFKSRLAGPKNVRILSIGGGVDTLAIRLAEAGNHIVSVDLSPVATLRTRRLAEAAGLSHRVLAFEGCCEELTLTQNSTSSFPGARFIAWKLTELCGGWLLLWWMGGRFSLRNLLVFLRRCAGLHRRVPFHLDAPCSHDETDSRNVIWISSASISWTYAFDISGFWPAIV